MTEVDNNTTTTGASKKKGSNLLIVVTIVILLAAAGGGYYYLNNKNQGTDDSQLAMSNTDDQGPVATVDGVELSRAEFESNLAQAVQVYTTQGVDTSDEATMATLKEGVVNTMINRQLVKAAAEKEGLTVSDDEIESNYQEAITNAGGEEAFQQALASAQLDEDSFRASIHDQLLLQKYIDIHASTDDIVVSDEEISSYYDSLKASNPDTAPLEEVSDTIKSQLTAQKQQEVIAGILDELHTDAQITTSL